MERAIPVLPVDDLDLARSFYVDGLGFQVRFEHRDAGQGMLGIARGEMWITLDCPMTGHGRGACVSLQVDDADAYHREWSARVPLDEAPRDEPWGARTFSVLDPSGNTIFVMGPPRSLHTRAETAPIRTAGPDPG